MDRSNHANYFIILIVCRKRKQKERRFTRLCLLLTGKINTNCWQMLPFSSPEPTILLILLIPAAGQKHPGLWRRGWDVAKTGNGQRETENEERGTENGKGKTGERRTGIDFTAWLWGWNVLLSLCDVCSADCRSICSARWWPTWTTKAG